MALKEFLIFCSNLFCKVPQYKVGDDSLGLGIKAYPLNTDINQVFLKVNLVNSICGTKILDTFPVAEHIVHLGIDEGIKNGDLSIIDKIRQGHGIKTKNGNDRNLYSFTSKYIHWHNPVAFPIYDKLVRRLLADLNNNNGHRFHPLFTPRDLENNYTLLKTVIDSLTSFTQLDNLRYRETDRALWLYAKYLYKRNQLQEDIAAHIQKAEKELLTTDS